MIQLQRAIGLALIALVPMMHACKSSSSATTASSTVESSKNLQADVDALNKGVKETATALEALRATTKTEGLINKTEKVVGDIAAAFKTYADSVDKIEGQRKNVASEGEVFKKQFTTYVTGWEASMSTVENADVRKAADQRRADARKNFDTANTQLAQMQTRLDALLADFVGVRSALQNDLNPDGMKAIDDVMKRAVKGSEDVEDDLSKVSKTLEAFSQKLLASAPPPPAEVKK